MTIILLALRNSKSTNLPPRCLDWKMTSNPSYWKREAKEEAIIVAHNKIRSRILISRPADLAKCIKFSLQFRLTRISAFRALAIKNWWCRGSKISMPAWYLRWMKRPLREEQTRCQIHPISTSSCLRKSRPKLQKLSFMTRKWSMFWKNLSSPDEVWSSTDHLNAFLTSI